MNAVVPINQNAAVNFNGHQLALIRRTVAADCNASEFDLFMAVAQSKGLDPFTKQVHAVVYNKDKPDKRKMAIITAIDGLRVIAERSGAYRPDEDEPEFTYDTDLKGPLNPLGLVKAKVRVWKNNKPATGVAYWEEFAPITDEWAWSEEKNKRAPTGKQALAEGNWVKMPRIMLSKCAEAQALRKAFPESMSGLYEAAEFDRVVSNELLPSEQVAAADTEDRLARLGPPGILLQLQPQQPLETIPFGQIADKVLETARSIASTKHLDWFESVNQAPLREFWARSPNDALELKKQLAALRTKLAAEEAAQ